MRLQFEADNVVILKTNHCCVKRRKEIMTSLCRASIFFITAPCARYLSGGVPAPNGHKFRPLMIWLVLTWKSLLRNCTVTGQTSRHRYKHYSDVIMSVIVSFFHERDQLRLAHRSLIVSIVLSEMQLFIPVLTSSVECLKRRLSYVMDEWLYSTFL